MELAEADSRVCLLTADLGFMALEPFADSFPDRFFNVGVAEQNMIGVATGLAEAGFVPFAYSIAPFAALRPYEFIRNGPAEHSLPVRIVGMGGGLEYGVNGVSHYALEDVAVMRAQPNMTVIAPADHRQAATAVAVTATEPGPIYFRLGKDDVTEVEGLEGRFELGRLDVVREGADVAIVAMGPIAAQAVAAADRLAAQGLECAVAVVASVSPAPVSDLVRFLFCRQLVLTVEAHYQNGGVGSLVAEVVAEAGMDCRLVRRAVPVMPDTAGSQAYMERLFGLAADQLVEAVLQARSQRPASR
jgi:transketolase